MDQTVAVVTPAYAAERWIAHAGRSVLAQSHPDWEWWVISDDGADYATLLAAEGLSDRRFRFLATSRPRSGASAARNLALEAINVPYVAILDADDRLKPGKLALAVAALAEYPIVSCALDVRDADYRPLRLVGAGPDRVLRPGAHKFVCLSMDSSIVWDRRRCDARYDTRLSNMTDLELLVQLWRTAEQDFHLGTPQHDYLKVSSSMSNGPGFSEGMIASKRELLRRLQAGEYSFADPQAAGGLVAFLTISLAAEAAYPAALAERPGLLFEDHLEPMLRAMGR